KIKLKKLSTLELGNLHAKRDWGYAKEYVHGMYLMLQAKTAENYLLATGSTRTVKDFIDTAFKVAEMDIVWEGQNENEVGIDRKTNKPVVKINPKFYRPAEVDLLIGDAQKAKNILGWQAKTSLEELCQLMVEADLRRNKNGISL